MCFYHPQLNTYTAVTHGFLQLLLYTTINIPLLYPLTEFITRWTLLLLSYNALFILS